MASNARRFTRRDFMRMAAGVVAGGVLAAACQPAAPAAPAAKPTEKKEAAVEKPAAPAEKIKLLWWSHTYKPWVEELRRQKEKYEEENPSIEIEYVQYPGGELDTKYTIALQAGTGPDILGAQDVMTPQLIAGDHLAEAPQWMVDDIKERFFLVCVEGATFRGKIYGYNQHIGARMQIANMGLLEANNAEPPKSWDDALALIPVIDKKEGGTLVQAVANYGYTRDRLFGSWGTMLAAWGGQTLSDDLRKATFNNDLGREATEAWLKFVHPEMGTDFEVFIQGKTVLFEDGPWIKAAFESQAPDLKYKTIGVLEGPKAKIHLNYVWNWVVNSAASESEIEASFKFTQWLNSVENQVSMYKASYLIPTTKESLDHPEIAGDEWARFYVAELEYKKPYFAKISNWQEVEKAMGDEFSLLAVGDQSIEMTLDRAEEAVDKLLEESEIYG